ncbi:unnamed protein product [Clonostachys rhizophaga]|uniref:Uncharacterized protein n=1 Tax=Clonostachys rhizophaga TaxID=160324 RepID=A0A9N9VGW2_9HYPO|nr:unnamed protein product [Clonostachys rhizophaga]
MTVRHRMPGTSSINAGKHGMRHYFDSYPPRLLSVTEIPSWYSNNSFVRSGYRPVTQSVSRCVQSLAYLHNETVNIYTHLVPALVSLAASFFFHAFFLSNYPKAIWQDEVIFQIYLTTTIFCFGISSVYHTLVCHSEGYAIAWVRLDLIAIVFQIIGSVVSGLYMGFYCEPTLQKTYWVMIVVLGTFSGAVNVLTDLDSTKWRLLRLLTLVATGFSALAPIIHAATMFPYWQLDKQTGLRFYYAEGVAMVSGVYFYAVCCSCSPPIVDLISQFAERPC